MEDYVWYDLTSKADSGAKQSCQCGNSLAILEDWFWGGFFAVKEIYQLENLCKILKFYSNIGFQNDLFITKSIKIPYFQQPNSFFRYRLFGRNSLRKSWHHKILTCTYIQYRAASGVFRTMDPPPPLPLASVSSPRTKAGGYTLAGRWEVVGQYFGRRQTMDWPLTVLSLYGWHQEWRGMKQLGVKLSRSCWDQWLNTIHFEYLSFNFKHSKLPYLFSPLYTYIHSSWFNSQCPFRASPHKKENFQNGLKC